MASHHDKGEPGLVFSTQSQMEKKESEICNALLNDSCVYMRATFRGWWWIARMSRLG